MVKLKSSLRMFYTHNHDIVNKNVCIRVLKSARRRHQIYAQSQNKGNPNDYEFLGARKPLRNIGVTNDHAFGPLVVITIPHS